MQLPVIDHELLNGVKIASPCSARWENMEGDNRARFCGECQKHVYNLSALTSREAATLIREKEGDLCAAFYRRADGTILTSDCPIGLRERLYRQIRRAGALVTALLTTFVAVGCDDGSERHGRERRFVGATALTAGKLSAPSDDTARSRQEPSRPINAPEPPTPDHHRE